MVGRGYYSDIAIDDVKLVSSCPNPGKLNYVVYIGNEVQYMYLYTVFNLYVKLFVCFCFHCCELCC